MSELGFANVEELDGWLNQRSLGGFWSSRRSAEEVRPWVWKGDDILRGLLAAGNLVNLPNRTVQPRNPGLHEGMTRTIHLSVHLLNPGERQNGHRNNVVENRFVLKADPGMVFVVNGEPFAAGEGDLVRTPAWAWHSHHNGGNEPAIWLDCMDSELVGILGRRLSDNLPGGAFQEVTKPTGYTAKTLRPARALAAADPDPKANATAFLYKWADTYDTLLAIKEHKDAWDPFDGVRLTYADPQTGGPTTPTTSCEIELLAAGLKTRRHRHYCTTLYHAFRGGGVTEIEGQIYEWSKGDIFVVPSWSWHHHEAADRGDAILFSISDHPAAAALGLYQEEADD